MGLNDRRMNPALKKVLAAVAVKEAIERIQDYRKPRRSFVRRNIGKIFLLGGLGAGAVYLAKRGKLPVGGARSSSAGYTDSYPTGPGTEPISPPVGTEQVLEPSGV